MEIKASWGGEKVGIEDTGLIGVVKWEEGDKIYVGHESGWLGELVASGVSEDGKTADFLELLQHRKVQRNYICFILETMFLQQIVRNRS